MSVTRRAAHCTPDAVFAVLADGWLFATWVVGAARIRDVDEEWPEPGSQIHHSVGLWPLLIDDRTHVLSCEPPHRLVLQARAWPAGEARVEITLAPTPAGCTITIDEVATHGPASLIPQVALDPLIDARNRESLRRLALLAEGRTSVDPAAPG